MAVRIVPGGLQSYDPSKVGKVILTPKKSNRSSSGSSSQSQQKSSNQQQTTQQQLETNRLNIEKLQRQAELMKKQAQEQQRIGNIKTAQNLQRAARIREVVSEYQRQRLKQVTQGTLTVGKEPSFIEKRLGEVQTAQLRGKATPLQKASLFGLGVLSSVKSNIIGIAQTPKVIKELVLNPSQIKNIPTNIKLKGEEFGNLLVTSPETALGNIAGELLFLKGSSSALNKLGKGKEIISVRLSPTFTKLNKNKIILTLNTGEEVSLKVGGIIKKGSINKAVVDSLKNVGRSDKTKIITPRSIVKPSNKVILEVVKSIPKKTLIEQTRLAGRKITAISSQREALFNILRRQRMIRKPIPGEELFSNNLKRGLKLFDEGKLNARQIIKLDKMVKREGAKGLLERTFFADPSGKVRPSRLGITKESEAGLLDFLSGDITFRRPKPQILLFDNIKVANFPKNLNIVKRKLLSGKTLTTKEGNALLNWQLKQSGKFKPVGFMTREAEVTLAPGEIIKKGKTVGTTLINGRKVKIIQASVYKPTGKTKQLISKFEKGKLTRREEKLLDKKLMKETGFNYGTSSSSSLSKKYFPIKRLSTSGVLSGLSKIRGGKRLSSYKPSKSKTSRTSLRPSMKFYKKGTSKILSKPSKSKTSKTGSSTTVPKTSTSPSRPITRGGSSPRFSPYKGSKTSKPLIIPIRGKGFKKRFKQKANSFNVYARPIKPSKGSKTSKLIKVNKKPLTEGRARDLRNYIIDTSLSRTGLLRPSNARPSNIRLNIPKGYSGRTSKKFRSYRIIKGRKVKLQNSRVIELSRNLLDTTQEKRKIDLRRRIAQINRPVRKVKMTATRRKELLGYLAKARRVKLNKKRR